MIEDGSNGISASIRSQRPRRLQPSRFARAERTSSVEDLQREIIDFDSEAPEGKEFLAFTTATGLSRYTDVPWPTGLAPKPDKTGTRGFWRRSADGRRAGGYVDRRRRSCAEPRAHARQGFAKRLSSLHAQFRIHFAQRCARGCPALELKRLGTYWTTKIGAKSVVVFKSDSHMSQDGPKLPNIDVWSQIISEVQPKIVITTGTAGGIGKQFEVGDVVVSPIVRFDCISKFKSEPFHDAHYSSVAPKTKYLATAKTLFKANSGQLPKENTRPPNIVRVAPTALTSSVMTTDFFGFDTSDNHYHLQRMADVSEMGDAVLGLVASRMGDKAPRWVAVRNVSDPQIKAEGTLRQQAQIAAQIYKGFGRWSSVCSAIVCWALIAAE